MTNPNRERWEREAAEAAVAHVPKFVVRDTVGETRARADGFSEGYLAACEKYAPRWVEQSSEEHRELIVAGWILRGPGGRMGEKEWLLWYPPAPPPPGGEE